jgi:hypothetical protein
VSGDEIVVTNGTYAGGVNINKPLTVRSVSGPQFTTISGGGPCVSMGNSATLTGFTVTNGAGGASGGTLNNCVLSGNTSSYYGGADYCTLNNCTLTGNSATYGGGASYCTLNNCTLGSNSAGFGGAASYCTLNNCTLTGNSANFGGGTDGCTLNNCILTGNSASGGGGGFGGGANGSRLNNCTLTGNWATQLGGGVWGESYGHTLNNCIAYFNTAPGDANYGNADLNNCCTAPLPPSGMGNITDEPLFVDYVGGNLRLQSSSPCINAGNNALAPAGSDLDGNPRIKGGTVDMGAYEFQTPTSIISYAWLQQYGLPTDGSADFADPDGDGLNNWQEWRCGTDPADPVSALRLLAPAASTQPGGVTVSWQSVAGINYFVQRSSNLALPAFTALATDLLGQAGITSFTDTNAIGAGPFFYRVGVGN